jgi:hypothetical protein
LIVQDNHSSKLIINDACYRRKKTLVSASVSGFFGQVSTLKSFKIDDTGIPYPSYRCLKINQNNEDDCEHLGVLGPIAGVLGSIQATEVIKQILGEKENLLGRLLIFDGLSYRMKLIKINWDQNNPLNGRIIVIMFKHNIIFITFLSLLGLGFSLKAAEIENSWGSLKYNKTYLRTGPSKDNKVIWVYKRKGLPIKIIRKKDDWNLILLPQNQKDGSARASFQRENSSY